MISYEEAKTLQATLARSEQYSERLEDFRRLRQLWHGKYWDMSESDSNHVSSVFRDMVQENNVSPELRLVHNLLQDVCVKYQTFLSPLPMIRMFTDYKEEGNTQAARDEANLKERYLYGVWSQRPQSMNQILNLAGWYLPLFGDCFLGIWPNPETNTPMPFIRTPEHAYPVPNYSDGTLERIVFRWEISEETARASFGNEIVSSVKARTQQQTRGRNKEKFNMEVLEYSDKNEFGRWLEGTKTHGSEHNFGYNLFEQIGFIQVPDEPWNHGAVEQIVGLVEMGNALLSLSFQAVLENVFPTMFLINPMRMPEELNLGPGGVVPINEGGDVKWVSPPTQAVSTQMQMLQQNEQNIQKSTHMPDVSFGEFDASIVTGKAINELQGAGTGSVIEMVQGTSLGTGLVSWNEKAIDIAQRLFKDDKAHLFGMFQEGMMDLNPKRFSLSVKGKELKGSSRNEVVFSPNINQQQKVVMGLQMAGAGLVSKKWQRDQVGIPDNQAMEEEIISETIHDAVLQGLVQSIVAQGEGTPESLLDAEERAIALLQGATGGDAQTREAPTVLPPAPGGAPPGLPPASPGGAPPLPAAPAEVGAEIDTGEDNAISLDEAIGAFQGVDVSGRVWLVGEIVQTGVTRQDIEVDVTDPSDRQTLADELPQYRGRLFFRVIETEPEEPFVEVTPGADTTPGGPAPDQFEDEELIPLA